MSRIQRPLRPLSFLSMMMMMMMSICWTSGSSILKLSANEVPRLLDNPLLRSLLALNKHVGCQYLRDCEFLWRRAEADKLRPGPYLRGRGIYGFNHPRNVEKKFFWQCIKARPAKCERWRTLCLHYCDARKSHLASIKCKKPLGQPGYRWGILTLLPQTP